jgi:hypothetical protein
VWVRVWVWVWNHVWVWVGGWVDVCVRVCVCVCVFYNLMNQGQAVVQSGVQNLISDLEFTP